MKPIHILGGGLAGLALGIALRKRGVPVRVSEAGRYPRHRVCGEFISGISPRSLEFLGLEGIGDDAERCASVAWHDERGTFFEGRLPEPALGISRYVLDRRLAGRFESLGGALACGTRARPSGTEGEVVATGRRPERGPWVGIKKHFHGLELRADLEMQLLPCGYIGFSRVGRDTVNACGLLRAEAVAGLPKEAVLETLLREAAGGLWKKRLEGAAAVPGSACAVAGFRLGWQQAFDKGNAVHLGDRLAMIPPFTGHGMSMAFESAGLAVEPLRAYAEGRAGWGEARRRIADAAERRFARRLRHAGWLHGLVLSPPGKDAAAWLGRNRLLPFNGLLALVR